MPYFWENSVSLSRGAVLAVINDVICLIWPTTDDQHSSETNVHRIGYKMMESEDEKHGYKKLYFMCVKDGNRFVTISDVKLSRRILKGILESGLESNDIWRNSMMDNTSNITSCIGQVLNVVRYDCNDYSGRPRLLVSSFPCSLYSLLQSKGIGKILANDRDIVVDTIYSFLRRLSSDLKEKDDRFEFRASLMGSMAELTSCGQPDEFDVRLDLLRIENDGTKLTEDSTSILVRFYDMLLELLHQIKPTKLSDSIEFIMFGFKSDNYDFLRLFFRYNDNKPMLVKVDLVPAVFIRNTLMRVLNPLNRDSYDSMAHKNPVGEDVTQQYHLAIQYHLNARNVISINSVCGSEICYMDSLQEDIKDGYVLTKIIAMLSGMDKHISSYDLKNSLFHVLKASNDNVTRPASCECVTSCDENKRRSLNVAYHILQYACDHWHLVLYSRIEPFFLHEDQ